MTVKQRPSSGGNGRRIVRRDRRATVGVQQPRRIVKRQRGVAATPKRQRRALLPALNLPALNRVLFAGAVCAVVAVLAGTGWWAWQSPLFRVGQVNVEGNRMVPAAVVVQTVDLGNQSLFTADLSTAERALAELPLLAGAEVKRSWPNGITVIVDEREPWGTWVQGGVAYTIDRDGVVLGSSPAPENGPVIRTAETLTLHAGDRVDAEAVEAAATIYETLPGTLGTGINEVAYVPGVGVQVEISNGLVGLLGDSSGIPYKLAVWAAVSERAAEEGINYSTIDLRYGNRPVLN